MKTVFATVLTGEEYTKRYFPSFYQSIKNAYKEDFDLFIATDSIELIEKYEVENVNLIKVDALDEKDYTKKASRKVDSYQKLFNKISLKYPENTNLCFLDSDTCIIKSIDHYFKFDFDIGFTFYHNHMTPYGDVSYTQKGYNRLNSGVVLSKLNKNSESFFKTWKKITNDFIENGSPLKKEFMGEDQDSLAYIVGINYINVEGKNIRTFAPNFSGKNLIQIEDNVVKVLGFTCRKLNEPESVKEITENSHIIHYKGGWRKILEKDDINWDLFKSSARKKENSINQYNIWFNNRKLFFNKGE